MSDFDTSVVEETQSSGASRKENLNQSEVRFKQTDQSETEGIPMEESVTDVFAKRDNSRVKAESISCDRVAVKEEPMQSSQLQVSIP